MPARNVLTEKLSAEEEAELGLVIRAMQDLCEVLNLPKSSSSLVSALVERLVGTALSRAKPNRRMAFLDQWRQFLCWLPAALTKHPQDRRLEIGVEAIRSFHLQDRRGKSKPGLPIPMGTNCLLVKNGHLWYAKVPEEDMPKKVIAEPPSKVLREKFQAGEQIYESEVNTSSIRTEHAEYLLPCNPPRVLKAEYGKLISMLSPQDPPDENNAASVAQDVPLSLIRRWVVESGVSRNDLALLIAARRAKLTAKATNLSHLHETLRWAR